MKTKIIALIGLVLSMKAQACGPQGGCSLSVQASGIMTLQTRQGCVGLKKKTYSCVFNYGANFQVLDRNQVQSGQYGSLVVYGDQSNLAINNGTVWNKIYLVDNANYKYSIDQSYNKQTVNTIGRLSNREIMITSGASDFDRLGGQSVVTKADSLCDILFKEVGF